MSAGFFQRKITDPILKLLKQGLTPEKLALSLALGAAIGVFPVFGTTTTLCTIVALVLRLNLPAIQIANYAMYPVQLALIIPFFRLGEKIFKAKPIAFSASQIHELFHASVWNALGVLGTTLWHAVVAWCLVTPVVTAVAYLILVPVLRRILRSHTPNIAEAA